MFLIFNLLGGFTDQVKDILSINKFTIANKIHFSIRFTTCRPIDNPCHFNQYNAEEMFDMSMFCSINEYFIPYSEISEKITQENTYDFYMEKVNGKLFKPEWNQYFAKLYSDILNILYNCEKEYIIVGSAFRHYSGMDNLLERKDLMKHLKPSQKILDELNKNRAVLPKHYNCIHYRYEKDWIPCLTRSNTPYIVPPIDVLIKDTPFKNNYKIYICCSAIELLKERGMMQNDLQTYDTILTKLPNNLNYDENGFLDYLIAVNSQEFYGNNISGFTSILNAIHGTNNNYNKLKIFEGYNILK